MENDTFGSRLKRLRLELKLSQKEIAKKLEISSHAYLNYEKGIVQPRISLLEKLRSVFKVNANWLLDGSLPMHNDIVFSESVINDHKLREFLFWLNKYSVVQFEALSSLEQLKIKHPDIFSEKIIKDFSNRKE